MTYENTPGIRTYRNYSQKSVAKAVETVNNDIGKKLAIVIFQIPRSALVNKCLRKHAKHVGRPTIFTRKKRCLFSRPRESYSLLLIGFSLDQVQCQYSNLKIPQLEEC